LRDELPKLFAGRNAIVFYATTEPHEALLFGGSTATLHEGRITQYGVTADVYRAPNSLLTAKVFSDPPINITRVEKKGDVLSIAGGSQWRADQRSSSLVDGIYDIGILPHHVVPASGSHNLEGRVLVTEISGSESVVHFQSGGQTWVSQTSGVQPIKVGETVRFAADLSKGLYFNTDGARVL
jgi:glycerol transport system ATP-binding protein